MKSSSLFQFGNEMPWQQAGEGAQRQVLGYDDKVMIVKVSFEKDAIGPMHSHSHSQATYIESGLYDMTIGDETKRIGPGDGYYVPPHVEHGIKCLEAGVLIDVFSPVREDFLT